MAKVIGIDLGQLIHVSRLWTAQNQLLYQMQGDRTTPSVVAYSSDNQVLVGQAAKRQAVTNPEKTLFAVKRLVGRKFKDDLYKVLKQFRMELLKLKMVMLGLKLMVIRWPHHKYLLRFSRK